MCRQVFRHVRNRFVAQSRWSIASVDSRPRLDAFSLRVFMFVPGRKLGQAPATLRFDVSQSHFLRASRCALVRGRSSHAERRRACRMPRAFPERMGAGSRLCGCLTPFAPAIVQPTLPSLIFSRAGSGGAPVPRAWGRCEKGGGTGSAAFRERCGPTSSGQTAAFRSLRRRWRATTHRARAERPARA